MRFKRSRRGVEAKVEPGEAQVLAQCAGELLELLGTEEEASGDPLEALVGLPPGDVSPPDDPALARLFPSAYEGDDAAATEFRRFTESDLRAGKRAAASDALVSLQPLLSAGGKLVLDRDQADAWLSWLNDIRLVLGTRLDVTEDTYEEDIDPEDPRWQVMQVYSWLGWLQESLLSCLDPRAQV
ncbi:MAG: hypothetical protein QOJ79_1849 [Actinomycetota bacterium]|nr:hypothetical protein [Actinomycetota bacterium]